MTVSKTRAALAALMLASSVFAITAAYAQDDRPVSDGDGSRVGRPKPAATTKAPAGATLSSAVAKPLTVAQTAMAAKKWPEALAATKDAMAEAKTDYEKMKVNQFQTSILNNTGDVAGATAAAEAAADTPADAIPADEKAQIYYIGTALALNAKHADKAVTYAKELQALNPPDPRMQDVIGKALYLAGDPGATAYFQKQVDAAAAAGKVPDRNALQALMAAQIKAKDEAAAEKTMVQQVLYFNDPADWKQIIDVTISTRGVRDVDAVMLGRLLFVSGATVTKDDAQLVGETTQKLALYGDAQTAQSKGATLQLDAARVASDKASLPQQIIMGQGQNGLFNVKLGEALYGYGMYAEAEAAAHLAQTKGGADASEVAMLLGMSQAMQGKYPDAIATFATVQGGGPATPRTAELWTAYAKIKGGLVTGQTTAAK
jgi:tetratricopeptide (TPR) repeat protein